MDSIDLVGTFAGTLTTLSFLPQVLQTWRTRSTRDISLLMFLLFSVGVFLWLIYGILLEAIPIIVTNGITLLLSSSILAMKLRELREARASGPTT